MREFCPNDDRNVDVAAVFGHCPYKNKVFGLERVVYCLDYV